MSRKSNPLEISGAIWIHKADAVLVGSDRIGLLEKIEEHGSITMAARAAGISYKTAWDVVNSLNNLSEKPLVRRMAGGRGGGHRAKRLSTATDQLCLSQFVPARH